MVEEDADTWGGKLSEDEDDEGELKDVDEADIVRFVTSQFFSMLS